MSEKKKRVPAAAAARVTTEVPVPSSQLEGAMTLNDILEAQGIEYETLEAWGGKVAIVSVTAGEVLEWIEEKDDPVRKREAGLRLIARSLVGSDGQRLCAKPDDETRVVNSLKSKDSRTCNAIVERIVKLNGITVPSEQVGNDSPAAS